MLCTPYSWTHRHTKYHSTRYLSLILYFIRIIVYTSVILCSKRSTWLQSAASAAAKDIQMIVSRAWAWHGPPSPWFKPVDFTLSRLGIILWESGFFSAFLAKRRIIWFSAFSAEILELEYGICIWLRMNMLDFACEKNIENPNSVDTPDLTSRTMWCSGRQTSHNPGCGYLSYKAALGRGWMGLGSDAKKTSRFFCGEVSVFHHGLTHFFATHGIGADTERARWVADAPCHWLQGYIRYIEQACSSLTEFCLVWIIPIPFYFFYLFLGLDVLSCHFTFSTTWSLNFDPFLAKVSRALRILTQSLFPSFQLAVFPLPGASWTATRLLAGEDLGGCCQVGWWSCLWIAQQTMSSKPFQGWRASDVWSSFDHLKQVVSSCRAWGSLLFSDGI